MGPARSGLLAIEAALRLDYWRLVKSRAVEAGTVEAGLIEAPPVPEFRCLRVALRPVALWPEARVSEILIVTVIRRFVSRRQRPGLVLPGRWEVLWHPGGGFRLPLEVFSVPNRAWNVAPGKTWHRRPGSRGAGGTGHAGRGREGGIRRPGSGRATGGGKPGTRPLSVRCLRLEAACALSQRLRAACQLA